MSIKQCKSNQTLDDVRLGEPDRTWEASKGVYSVCLPSPQNQFSMSIPSNFMIQTGTLSNNYADEDQEPENEDTDQE